MKMLILLLFIATGSFGQSTKGISVVDFIKVKDGRLQEALYYYENNWKVFRDIAVQKNIIKTYSFLLTKADSVANFEYHPYN
ncbi:MAG: hypothetical protein ABI844_15455 [Saprospiraceae bacterium]